MFKKVFIALVISVLSVSVISTTAFASGDFIVQKSKDNFEVKIPNNDLDDLNKLEPVDDEYTIQSIIVEMDKPIKYQAKVPNSYLKVIIDNYHNEAMVLDILQALLFYKGQTAPAGLLNSLGKAISGGGIDAIKYAYARGEDMYLVTVYASGVNPSLSTISYRYFSKTPLKFVYWN